MLSSIVPRVLNSSWQKKVPNYTGRVVPITNQPEYQLSVIVRALNGKLVPEQVIGEETRRAEERRQKETPLELRQIVQLWQSSGPDLFKFGIANRELNAEVLEYWEDLPKRLLCVPGGGAAIGWNSGPGRTPREEALRLFIELIINPMCDKLAGPCARCSNYYIRRSAHNKLYCSRSCGTRATALAATKKRRQEERNRKLLRASQLSRQWRDEPTKLNWKQWVSRKAPDITPKFLTRAVKSGDLTAPIRNSSREN